jgi:acyl-CoA dehydrogenase
VLIEPSEARAPRRNISTLVPELDPDAVVRRIDPSMLARRSTDWIVSFYRWLAPEAALRDALRTKPMIRCSDGQHVAAIVDDEPQVWLPPTASPGVEVRPLRQMTGGSSFNEVVFHDVFVPDDNRLGDVNDGWRVVMTSLAEERARIRNGPIGESTEHFRRVLELARAHQRTAEPLVRDRLAQLAVLDWATALLGQRIADIAGPQAGAELALTKLALVTSQQLRSDVVCDVLGASVCADVSDGQDWGWADFVLSVPALGIAGGTDEIVRNTLGERVLGLPREPGRDSHIPFKDLASS